MPTAKISNKDNGTNQAIFDLTPFPMWIYDLKTFGFLAVNKEAIRQYGYTQEEFLSMTIKQIRPREDIPKLEKAVEKARTRTELYKQSLHRHQRRDGRIMWVKIKSNLINYNGKEAEIVTAIDLTDNYEQKQIIEEQKKFLSIIGEINQVLLVSNHWSEVLNQCFQIANSALNADRIYFFQNNLNEQTTSQKIEWVKNTNKHQIDNPELQNVPLSQFQVFMEPLQKGKPFEAIVSKLPTSPTKDILVEKNIKSTLVFPIIINNDFSGFIGIEDFNTEKQWDENQFHLLRNLTSNLGHIIKEEQAHQKLKDSEAKFKSLVIKGTDLIAVVDHEGFYKYVAPNPMSVLGIAPEEFMEKNAFDFIHEKDARRVAACLEKVLKKKRISIDPYRFCDADGNWRWIQTELTNHLNNPAINGIVANSWEVTAEIEKRKGDKLIATMTKAIARPGSSSYCLKKSLKKLNKNSDAIASEIWLISEDKQRLNLISKSSKDRVFKKFHKPTNPNVDSFNIGEGLPGHIWHSKKMRIWPTLPNKGRFTDENLGTTNLNNHAAIGFPIFYNHEFIGCIICFYSENQKRLSQKARLLNKVVSQIGAVIKQKITEEKYRNFFDISPDPHCIIGFDGLIKEHNSSFSDLLEYEKQDTINQSIFNFIHPDDQAESMERLKSSIQNNSSKSFEIRFLTKNSEVRWLIWSGAVIAEAKIFFAVAKEITEQKLAEQALGTAYKRLEAAQKIAKLGYWTKNLDSEIVEWNDETYKIFGYTPENFTPSMESITEAFHPEDRQLIESDPLENLKPGKIQSFENRIFTSDQKIKWVHQEIRLLTNNKSIPYRIEGTIQDITEKKAFEQELSMSNERFRLAMKASNEMIWEIDHNSNKITRSEVYKDVFDYHLEERFNKTNSWFNKIHPEDFERVNRSMQNTLDDHKASFWLEEYRIFSKNGTMAYVTDRSHIIRNEKGSPVRSVGSILDVTFSRKQLELIKQQNKSLREIAWIQSHIIRAPLSRIMGLIYLHKEFENGEKSTEEIFDMIGDSANELDKIIHDITNKTNAIISDDTKDTTNR